VSPPPRADTPRELALLRERLTEVSDLESIAALLFWDQNVTMPRGGAGARAEAAGTLRRLLHRRLVDPELGRLLDGLEPWAAGEDPDSDAVRLLAWVRREHETAVRVPEDLAAALTRAGSLGQQAWERAREASDFGRFRDALALHLELRHRYVACFDPAPHAYDHLLDLFEPGMTTAQLRPLFAELREALVPLVAAAGDRTQLANDGVFAGPFEPEAQKRAVLDVLEAMGFHGDGWRLDPAPHPFAQGIGAGDVRITTRYDEHDLSMALYSALHEFGHGLYEAGIDPALRRTPLADPVSLGVHESQSRLWENALGRSRPFCEWLLPRLRRTLPGPFDALEPAALYRAVNTVQPSLIRIEADQTTYNLHIVLRFELELRLVEGTLAVDDVPAAWSEGMHELLGVEVPDDAHGVLQDVHWGAGLFGYFPTYTVGNVMAAQLWAQLEHELPDLEADLAAGRFAPLREWLREHVHRHGRKFLLPELLHRSTGGELSTAPFLAYLRGRLVDSGVLAASA
jgi:carboxypeptidase Taq